MLLSLITNTMRLIKLSFACNNSGSKTSDQMRCSKRRNINPTLCSWYVPVSRSKNHASFTLSVFTSNPSRYSHLIRVGLFDLSYNRSQNIIHIRELSFWVVCIAQHQEINVVQVRFVFVWQISYYEIKHTHFMDLCLRSQRITNFKFISANLMLYAIWKDTEQFD